MTRKDYVLIARAIRESRLSEGSKAIITAKLAEELKQDNERFDSLRFAQAVFSEDGILGDGRSMP